MFFLYRQTVAAVVSRGAGAAGSIMFAYLLSKIFGYAVLGEFTVAFSVAVIASVLSVYGTDLSITRFSGNISRAVLSRLYKRVLARSVTVTLGSGIGYMFFLPGQTEYLPVLASSPFMAANSLTCGLLRGHHKVLWSALFDYASIFLLLFISLLVASLFVELNKYQIPIIQFLLVAIICIASLLPHRRLGLPNSGSVTASQVWALARNVGASSTFLVITVHSVFLILGVYFTSEQVGSYRLFERIAVAASFPLLAVAAIAPRIFADAVDHGDRAKLRAKYWSLTLPLIPSSLLMVILALFVTAGDLGGDMKVDSEVLYWLVLGQLLNCAFGPVGQLLNVSGYEIQLRNITFITGLVSLGLIALVSAKSTITSVAVIQFSTLGVQNILSFIYVRRLLYGERRTV